MTKNFEDFQVYQKSLELTSEVFQFLKHNDFLKEFEFNNQLKRATFSISNNIAEGSEYNNNRQFTRYLKISKGSCAEVRSMLIMSKKLQLGDSGKADESIQLAKEISTNISNFIKYLSQNIEKKQSENF